MLQDLDPKLINALEELRREFDDKLSQQRLDFERLVGSTSQLAEPEPEPAPQQAIAIEPQPVSGLDPLEELKLAAAEIDRSESQADVLDALIRGTARFSSRTAVFLCRDNALHGWGGTGFGKSDPDIRDMTLEGPDGSPWKTVTSGDGGVCLSSEDCSLLLDRLGAEEADMGVLIPFILRRQVAAIIYSDKTDQNQAFNISGLQLLSFLAGQTVETLPLRDRSETNSLQLAVAPSAGTTVTTEADDAARAATEEKQVPVEAVEEPDVEEDSVDEYAREKPTFEEPEPVEDPAEEMVTSEVQQVVEDFRAPDFPPPILETPVEAPPEITIPPEIETLPDALQEPDRSPVEEVPEAEEPAPADLGAVGEEPAAASPTLTSTQVQPPQDVEGPGWAFTTTRIPTAAGVEALHEEARRLARLLVTEIKLYNEELVEEGRQAGDVYSRLREDIERSRQIFDDRIDPEVRSEKDYFREALVRILAGGDSNVMGIPG
jgi:hypothetical protein